ncbi:MAG: dTDP-glucose pyrophosphorylase [Pseudomonadota bacterium]
MLSTSHKQSRRLTQTLRKKAVSGRKLIGLLPAGGKAARVAPLPCSKELYPVGFRSADGEDSVRPKVACHYLLEKMRLADVTKAYIILRKGKWDIPGYLGDGKMLDMHLAYLIMGLPFGVPYTLDQAYPFVHDAMVVFGFPDIIFQPDDAFVTLLAKQSESDADVVLGLFPAHQPHKMDMVDLDVNGRIRGIQIKSGQTHLRHTWIIAIWTPAFTRFMHDYVSDLKRPNDKDKAGTNAKEQPELFVGDIIQAAINNNDIQIDTVLFSDGSYLDIGTPEDMVRAVQITNRQMEDLS